MSQPSKSLSEQVEELDLPTDAIRRYYHVPVVAALFAFMLWIRTRVWSAYVDGDTVLFAGNDAYYHYRSVQYTVEHFPATMPFDPWTSFPTGTSVGQFGTLFDQLIAAGALLYGLGSPTEVQVKLATLFAPAVFGALTIIPVFYLGKRLGGKAGGIVAALILALTPGQFLTRSIVGFSDHHVGEALFMGIAVVLVLAALAVAERDRPIWELFTARDWDALRPTLLWSTAAGVAVGLYIWVWPPGVFLAGILSIFFGAYLLATFLRGHTPDHIGIPGAIILATTAVMTLLQFDTATFGVNQYSITQPFVAAAGMTVCLLIVGGARLWGRLEHGLPRTAFPAVLVVAGLVVIGLAAVILPDLVGFFRSQLLRVVGFGATDTARTVAEATPVQNPGQFVYNAYGLAFYTAIGGLVYLTYRTLKTDHIDPVGAFVVIWSLFLLAAMFTQRRFDYYFVLSVCALNAFLAKRAFTMLDVDEIARNITNVKGYQVLSIVAILLIITAPLAVRPAGGTYSNVVETSSQQASPGSVENWEPGLSWLDERTPEEGEYGENPETALSEGPYGTYQRTDDFDYGSGDYGVLAWWDYGHWITVLGDRVPNANPFQQNAQYSAEVLLSPDETYATERMADTGGDGEQTRYVMLDYQLGMAGTRKFVAPTAWQRRYAVDNESGEHVVGEFGGSEPQDPGLRSLGGPDVQQTLFVAQQAQGQTRLVNRYAIHTQRSMESLRTRLYQYHGSRAEPTFRDGSVVVADWERFDYRGQTAPGVTAETQPVRTFPNRTAAEQFVRRDGTAQIGGVLGKPSEPVPALEHHRLVWASERTTQTPISRAFGLWSQLNQRPPQPIETQPYLKTFERVGGATVEGQGPANTNVTAAVQMRIPTNNRTFTYEQQVRTGPDGEFTMTVPYSTTGYDEFGPDNGQTNVSVRATGPYQFTTPPTTNESLVTTRHSATANVTEAQVLGRDESAVQVTLDERVLSEPEGRSGTNDTDSTDSTSGGGSNSTDATSTPTPTPSQSLAPPAWLTLPFVAG
jgi:dolichyl-diphosphooligosaccharide--protein glycosyltransferase